MDGGRKQGRLAEEMFITEPEVPPPETEIPTVSPLRINKAGTTSPTPASSQPPHPAPTSKPPSAPLPYPDDARRPSRKSDSSEDGRGRANSTSPQSSNSPRPKFSADDPNKPTAAGYAHNPAHGTGQAGSSAQPGKSLGERRGNQPKPLPDSPGPETPDRVGLFQKAPDRLAGDIQPAVNGQRKASTGGVNPFPDYHQQYWPPPSSSSAQSGGLRAPGQSGVQRLDSTASVSTTRAQRGSPPPPETPIIEPASGGIEARYAAAMGGGAQQSSAAQQRAAQYSAQQRPADTLAAQAQQTQPPRRPWTPTEAPGSQPYGAPQVYQGMNAISSSQSPPPVASNPYQSPPQPASAASSIPATRPAEHPLEQDMSRLNLHEEPPPAYSSVQPVGGAGSTTAQGYPNEKSRQGSSAAISPQPTATPASAVPDNAQHPAFANDPRIQANATASLEQPISSPPQAANVSPVPAVGPASPPPLPEGWIAHLDPNSGQYYYIHLPTQSTQWEFPKGPTPLNLNEPMSPTGTFINPLSSPSVASFSKPLATPGFQPQTVGYRPETALSMTSMHSPTASVFTGPPPSAGVDIYKVQPTNGVYFGPYLRYTNMDLERGLWLGSIMLITDAPQPPTIHIHQSVDLSANPRQLKPSPIFSHQRWIFFRYEVDLKMEEQGTKWTYAITSHLGCTRYEFLVAGRYETSWRFIAHSGNDFAMNVNPNERAKLGGVGFMWKDILQKHIDCNGFHAQLGLGGQINADRMWKEIPLLKQWTATSGKENRKNAPWTPRHEEDITHAYFHYYTSHFDQPHLREAFAQIPHILSVDDHDLFDGFGSYPEYMQFSNMFKNIGRIGMEMFLLFQHHTTLDLLRNVSDDIDIFTITGTGWHFIKFLGPAVVVVGPDTRSERNLHQVMAGPTYQGLFPKVAVLPPSVQHCIWMLPVPIVYPRLESMEHLANTVATGKKAVTGAFNMAGKVAGGLAGVVGAKGAVNDGFNAVKKAVGKSGLMSGVISPFGEIDLLDELRDQWTHESKDLERTYLIRTLQGIAHNKSLRMSFFSGSVSCCGAGLVYDAAHPQDHKTMYQIITCPVVNAPVSGPILRMLHNNKPLYVPTNGHRSNNQPSDTKEDMMEIFGQDVTGAPRETKRLMARRNYVACVAFDPATVGGAALPQAGQAQPAGKLSLAIDFMVQGEGTYAGPVKYGPVIVPSLEYGK